MTVGSVALINGVMSILNLEDMRGLIIFPSAFPPMHKIIYSAIT